MARVPERPLAIQYFHPVRNRGLAWFPAGVPNEVEWVRALLALWAESDPAGLPGFRDWHVQPEWMVNEELAIARDLSLLDQERAAAMERFAAREAELRASLLAASQTATSGPRRVLTGQGDDLVDAVAQMFEDLGFKVANMDAERPPGVPRREDLRLTTADRPSWEAIVEVKGYTKSGGKTADLHQLQRHATHYAAAKGRPPDQQIYVINGEIESVASPALRRLGLHAEDIQSFAASEGLVLATPDLFCLHRDRSKIGLPSARQRIVDSRGLFAHDRNAEKNVSAPADRKAL